MEEVQLAIAFAEEHGVWWGALMLMVGAGIEYVFPPFPGDSVVIAGAVLIPTAGWSPWVVFAAVMLGSMLGGAVDWRLGIWLADRLERDDDSRLVRFLNRPKMRERYDWVVDKFDRHGAKFLALNRFLPVFRSFFFVAAGLARLELRWVMAWAALSAAVWNALLLGVGVLVGYNIESLVTLLERYTVVVLGSLAFFFIAAKIAKYLRKRRTSAPD